MNREAANVKKIKDSLASPAVVALIDAISDTSGPDNIVSIFAEFPFDNFRVDVTTRLDQLADPDSETNGETFELRELITDEIKTYVHNTGSKIISFFNKVKSDLDSLQVQDMAELESEYFTFSFPRSLPSFLPSVSSFLPSTRHAAGGRASPTGLKPLFLCLS